MENWQERTERVLGAAALARLAGCRVVVLGLGGVGGQAAEALARAGVGHLVLVDSDCVALTNLNRQLVATRPALGQSKATVLCARLLAINPDADIALHTDFVLPENAGFLFDDRPDYIVDAIDTVTTKLFVAQTAAERGIPHISCMGTGNRLDPSRLAVGDIADTAGTGCPLARIIRRECARRGIPRLTVVYSTEPPRRAPELAAFTRAPGSTPFVPPAAGLLLASRVVRDLLELP